MIENGAGEGFFLTNFFFYVFRTWVMISRNMRCADKILCMGEMIKHTKFKLFYYYQFDTQISCSFPQISLKCDGRLPFGRNGLGLDDNIRNDLQEVSYNFDVHMSVHCKYISKVQRTKCNVFSIYLFL